MNMANSNNGKGLVIVRCGAKSLHPKWSTLSSDTERDFDIFASYYTDKDSTSLTFSAQDQVYYNSGSKWEGIHELLCFLNNESILDEYDYIWLPDDDILTCYSDISKLFDIARILNLILCQPSLSQDSYFTHLITCQHKGFLLRYTNFVEVMVPMFKTSFLKSIIPTFSINRSGWGLEAAWLKYLRNPLGAIAVIDLISVIHTREVASAGSGVQTNRNRRLPYAEAEVLHAISGSGQRIDNLCGLTRNFRFLTFLDSDLTESLAADALTFDYSRHACLDWSGTYTPPRDAYHRYIAGSAYLHESSGIVDLPKEVLDNLATIGIGLTSLGFAGVLS